MKQMIVYCCVGTCSTVLHTMEWDTDSSEYIKYECIGDVCDKCKEAEKKPIKFTPIRMGVTNVTAPNDFEAMMAKRKLENRKKSGKGAGRANR